MTTTYPLGYGTSLVQLERLKQLHGPKMHPEFDRRIWPWLESMNGLIGIGSGWRAVQPTGAGFAPAGKSFHESQTFRSGIVAYCALDLVARDGSRSHRAPTWGESTTARQYLLHTFVAGEPWHIQPVEIRGWQTWADAGRPDPVPPSTPQPPKEVDMEYVKLSSESTTLYQRTGNVVRWITPDAWDALGNPMPTKVLTAAEAKVLILSGPTPDRAAVFARQVA